MNDLAWIDLELANDRVRETRRYRTSRPRRVLARVLGASTKVSLDARPISSIQHDRRDHLS